MKIKNIILYLLVAVVFFANTSQACVYPPIPILLAHHWDMEYFIVDRELILNASASSGFIVKYSWDFENDGVEDYYETPNHSPDGRFDGYTTHQFTSTGDFSVKLTVTDINGLSNSATKVWKISTDNDNDEMPDAWELLHGILSEIATDDHDSDGYSNLCEFLHSSDPLAQGDDSQAPYFSPFGKPAGGKYIPVPSVVSSVQKAINHSVDTDHIVLDTGEYDEAIISNGLRLTIRSHFPYIPEVVAQTILSPTNNPDAVVTYNDSEGLNSYLKGLTIRGGKRGVYCANASPQILGCVIENNGEPGYSGGGILLSNSNAEIKHCYIANNSAPAGGGVFVFHGSPRLIDTVICNNSGGGVHNINATLDIINCTISGNVGDATTSPGAALTNLGVLSDVTIGSSILWNNLVSGSEAEVSDAAGTVTVSQSDIYGGFGGSLNQDPAFVNSAQPAGSDNLWGTEDDGFALSYLSPCIDAGDGALAVAAGIANGCHDSSSVANTGTGTPDYIDLGVYEQMAPIYVSELGDDITGDGSTSSPYATIAKAISEVQTGNVVVLKEGTYNESVNFDGIAVTVRSTDPYDDAVVDNTIISGLANSDHTVVFANGEDSDSRILGLTITEGATTSTKATVSCVAASPIISRCKIKTKCGFMMSSGGPAVSFEDSSAEILACEIRPGTSTMGAFGDGIYSESSSLKILDCDISGDSQYNLNTAISTPSSDDSSISLLSTTIDNVSSGIRNVDELYIKDCNIKSWNDAITSSSYISIEESTVETTNHENGLEIYTGVLVAKGSTFRNCSSGIYSYGSDLTVEGCSFIESSYGLDARYDSNVALANCNFIDNATSGIYCYQSKIVPSNCIFADNDKCAIQLSESVAEINNCTITKNCSDYGDHYAIKSIESSSLFLRNSILWDNEQSNSSIPKDISQTDQLDSHISYSCIEQYGAWGPYNFSEDPEFDNPAATTFARGNYELEPTSLCIDGGKPGDDCSNEPSPNGGVINVGAFGNTADATESSYAYDSDADGIRDSWEKYYWPGDDVTQHTPTGNDEVFPASSDDFNNLTEYVFGYKPSSYNQEAQPPYYNIGTPLHMYVLDQLSSVSELDPIVGESKTIQVVTNQSASIAGLYKSTEYDWATGPVHASPNAAQNLGSVTDPGVPTSFELDAIDTNGKIIPPDYYDFKLTAQTANEIYEVESFIGNEVQPGSPKGVLEHGGNNYYFDPYKNDSLDVTYTISEPSRVEFAFVSYRSSSVSHPWKDTMMRRLFMPGENLYEWYGWGEASAGSDEMSIYTFIEYSTLIDQDTKEGALLVHYGLPFYELRCVPYRIIPSKGDLTAIYYKLMYDMDVTITVYDPDEEVYVVLKDSESQTAGVKGLLWDGKDCSGNCPTKRGQYRVEFKADKTGECAHITLTIH